MPFLLLKRVGMLVSLTRKGCHTICLLCVASGRAGFRFYQRPGVTRGQKAHCRMATAAGRTDEGLAGNSECVHGGVIIGQCLIFNVLLNVLNLCDSALPF